VPRADVGQHAHIGPLGVAQLVGAGGLGIQQRHAALPVGQHAGVVGLVLAAAPGAVVFGLYCSRSAASPAATLAGSSSALFGSRAFTRARLSRFLQRLGQAAGLLGAFLLDRRDLALHVQVLAHVLRAVGASLGGLLLGTGLGLELRQVVLGHVDPARRQAVADVLDHLLLVGDLLLQGLLAADGEHRVPGLAGRGGHALPGAFQRAGLVDHLAGAPSWPWRQCPGPGRQLLPACLAPAGP
jgi:hypothetical protein